VDEPLSERLARRGLRTPVQASALVTQVAADVLGGRLAPRRARQLIAWTRRAMRAWQDGEPFDEPTPDARRGRRKPAGEGNP
jgi:hypothetical protein